MAARLKGADDRRTECDQECPVCMLYYTEVNVTKCCSAAICSECFLQIRPQKTKTAACPYCNSDKFSISVAKKPTVEDIDARNKEEQTVIEARIRANSVSGSSGGGGLGLKPASTDPVKEGASVSRKHSSVAPDTTSTTSTTTSGFGSELAKDERFLRLKKRSESFASNEGVKTPDKDREIIESIAMTPEERRRLEEEMKAQLNHPLTLQVEAEAEQRRVDNEREYYRNNPAGAMRAQRSAELQRLGGLVGGSGSRRARGGPRDWNSIVDHFERGGNGEVGSLDDLVVLEAAILLSMQQEARRSQEEGGRDSGSGFDANQHARDGFPLVRSLLSGQGGRSNRRGEDGSGSTASSSSSTAASAAGRTRSLAGGSSSVRRLNRGLMGDTALSTASMMMRGISEEEQIAMAIAASLQDQNSSNMDNNDNDAAANTAMANEESSSSGRSSNDDDDDDTNPSIRRADGTQDNSNSSTIDGDSEANTITELAEVVTSGASGGQSDLAIGTPSLESHEEAAQVSDDGNTRNDDV